MNSIGFKSAKRHITLTAAFMFLALQFGCQGGLPIKQVVTGKVTKVHDGDSIHITPVGKRRVVIRLAGIDAPEIDQQHGYTSRDFLRGEILNREVAARCTKQDRYNRQVCVVLYKDIDINLKMLNAGHAWYYTKYRHEQSRSQQRAYRKAESKARKQKQGLWQSADAIAPWEFRSKANAGSGSGSGVLELLK